MKGLGSKALSFGGTENKYRYNGKETQNKEFTDGSGLEWMDYGARMYDAQTGKFFTLDRFVEKYFDVTPFQYALNNPIVNIDVNGDSILTFFYDKNGNQVNTIPDAVKNAYAEMGIDIGYNAETNMLYGSAIEGSILTEAGELMLQELGDMVSDHSLLFGYDLSYNAGSKTNGILFGYNLPMGDNKSLSLIDLGDFNADGSAKGRYSEKLSTKTFNLTRTIEHEYIGHGVAQLKDEPNGPNDPGPNERLLGNPVRKALNLPERMKYVGRELMTGNVYIPFGDNGTEVGRHVLTREQYNRMSTGTNEIRIIMKFFSK